MNNQYQHKYPFFSIIIPTYRRNDSLLNCLKAISHLNYPVDKFEVIIVDDGSEDKNLNILISKFINIINITLISQSHKGPSASRNNGRRHSQGEFLVFTDDDCTPDPEWLTIFAQHFNKNPDYALTGRTINALSYNIYSATSAAIIDFLYNFYNSQPDAAKFAVTSNLSLSARQFDIIGGFDEEFTFAGGEDRDFSDRWILQGYKIIYVQDAVVSHFHRLWRLSFCKLHYNYGRAAYLFAKKKGQRRDKKITLESFKFYFRLLVYAKHQSKEIFILAILSQVFTMFGYVKEMMSLK